MRLPAFVYAVGLVAAAVAGARPEQKGWLPSDLPPPPADGPALCQSNYLTPEQGAAVLSEAMQRFSAEATWREYAAHARQRIQQGARLSPWPRRTPLNAVVHSRRSNPGYTVQNVAFESVPGFFVTGNLYLPEPLPASLPVMLTTHGHSARVEKPSDYDTHGRFSPSVQTRCAMLARLGVAALSIDMFGYGDSILQVGQDAHRQPFSLTLQTWNAIRAIDYLLSLPGADPRRVGVTGESGGGTQAFLLAGLDDRITLSVPVVMVSAHFFGGCPCESGLPIHRSPDHFLNNAMIAALAAPRPQLLVSDGDDWTARTPEVEYPFLRHIYGLFDAGGSVALAHFPAEGHDYGPRKRAALYRFVARQFALGMEVRVENGTPDEGAVTIEKSDVMHAFSRARPLPAHALRDAAAVAATLARLQRPE